MSGENYGELFDLAWSELADEGLIECCGDDRWRLTGAGEKAIAEHEERQ